MSLPQEAGKVAGGVVDALKGTPMLLALLIVNAGFLGIVVYLMGEAVANSAERNRTQLELIGKLVGDIRDCRQGPKTGYDPFTRSLMKMSNDTQSQR